MESKVGKLWFSATMLKVMKKMKAGKGKKEGGFSVDMKSAGSGMMEMMGGFSVLRLTSMLGMANVSFTKEELLDLNRQLNRIKKPVKKTEEEKQKEAKTKKTVAICAAAAGVAATAALVIGKLASKNKK
jgi:hypothetical protein